MPSLWAAVGSAAVAGAQHALLRYACVTPISCRASTSSAGAAELKTNFVSDKPSSWFAELYQKDQLTGGHVIMLGADEGSK
jgi:hypothetical protein